MPLEAIANVYGSNAVYTQILDRRREVIPTCRSREIVLVDVEVAEIDADLQARTHFVPPPVPGTDVSEGVIDRWLWLTRTRLTEFSTASTMSAVRSSKAVKSTLSRIRPAETSSSPVDPGLDDQPPYNEVH
jgi:hypothetical protein